MEFAFLGAGTAAEWAEWELTNTQVLDGALVISRQFASERILDSADVVDVDRTDCGTLHLLGSDGRLSQYDPGRGVLDRAQSAVSGDDTLGRPVALAVTDDTVFLAIEDRDGNRDSIRALSRRLLRTRWVSQTGFEHVIALVATDNDVYVLDRGAVSEAGRVIRLRRDGTTDVVIDGLDAPVDVAVDSTGNCYVLDHRGDQLVVGRFEAGAFPATFEDDAEARGTFPEGTTCIETEGVGVVVAGICPGAESETTLYRYRFVESSFERLVDFEGDCTALLARERRGFYALAQQDDRAGHGGGEAGGAVLYFLEAAGENRPRPHRRQQASEFGGQAVKRFDSSVQGTEWHRLTLERHLGGRGTQTQVRVNYFATDVDDPTPPLESLDGIGQEYASRLRDAGVKGLAELAGLDVVELAETIGVSSETSAGWIEDAWTTLTERWEGREVPPEGRIVDPRDALLESATGRYLWVKLDLTGTADSSPRVETFRAYFPRDSFLRYLPAIYLEDEASARFLLRFLSIFESTFVDIEEGTESLTRYFDPRGVDEEYLSWLGRWLGVGVDETWHEGAKRELLARAPELFKTRGTRAGLLEMVRIYLDGEKTTACAPRETDPGGDIDEADDGDVGEASTYPPNGTNVSTGETTGGGKPEDGVGDGATGNDEVSPAEGSIGPPPYIWEYSDLDWIEDDATGVRMDYQRVVGHPREFVLLLDSSVTDEQLRALERIVEADTPAHAVGRVVRLRPWIQLGTNAYLGVNSYLPTRELVLERSILGEDSVLVGRETPL